MAVLRLALFGAVAKKMGPSGIATKLVHIWIGLSLLLAISAVRLILRTYSWCLPLQAHSHRISEALNCGGKAANMPGMQEPNIQLQRVVFDFDESQLLAQG